MKKLLSIFLALIMSTAAACTVSATAESTTPLTPAEAGVPVDAIVIGIIAVLAICAVLIIILKKKK